MIDALTHSRFALPVLRLVCVLSAGVLLIYSLQWMPRVTHGFAMYYTYSRTVLEGHTFAPLYEVAHFHQQMRAYGIVDITEMPNNPPTTALAALPVAWLSPSAAKVIWTSLLLCAFAASLILLLKTFDIQWNSPQGLMFLTLGFLWRPAYENIAFGQIHIFLLLGFSISLWSIARNNSAWTAIPVGVSLATKGYGPALMLWFGFVKRWRELVLAPAVFAALVVVTLPLFGIRSWIAYFSSVVSSLGLLPEHAHVAYQTINSLVFHLFTYDSQWLPFPVWRVPAQVLRITSYTLNAGIIAFVMLHTRSASAPLGFAVLVATSVVTAPLAEEHHYVLFLPLVAGLAATIRRRYHMRRKLGGIEMLYFGSTLLLALPLPFESLQGAHAPLVLLAYPKLYAGLALLFCFRRLTRHRGAQ
jgi:hypothetical protein